MLQTQKEDGGAKAGGGGSQITRISKISTKRTRGKGGGHNEIEEGKPAGSGKCSRVESKRYITHISRSYFACKNKGSKAYKEIEAVEIQG